MCFLQRFGVTDADLEHTVTYSRRAVKRVFRPLIETIAADVRARNASARRRGTERYLLAVAGPPGSGKSTVAALLRGFFAAKGIRSLVLPLDGFHLKNEELKRRKIVERGVAFSLYERKGSKESYDVERLLRTVKALRIGDPVTWPVYSRTLHEPVEEGVRVVEGGCVCIVEGNYILLDVEPWNRLRELFDARIMILGKPSLMRRRIVSRKIRGGFTRSEAEAHYRRSDALNIDEVTRRSGSCDFLLVQRGRFGYALRQAAKGGSRRA